MVSSPGSSGTAEVRCGECAEREPDRPATLLGFYSPGRLVIVLRVSEAAAAELSRRGLPRFGNDSREFAREYLRQPDASVLDVLAGRAMKEITVNCHRCPAKERSRIYLSFRRLEELAARWPTVLVSPRHGYRGVPAVGRAREVDRWVRRYMRNWAERVGT